MEILDSDAEESLCLTPKGQPSNRLPFLHADRRKETTIHNKTERKNREELAAQQGEPLYTPEHVYVVTDANTFSAAFHYAYYLWKMGATVVGVPCRQAPNTYMEVTPFRLPRTGLEGSISNTMQVFLPPGDQREKVFYPDLIPTYDDYRAARFDNEAEIIFLLKSIGLPGLPG